MSFFKKLLGGTFETNREEGNVLFEERGFGEARLAYERALAKAGGKQPASAEAVAEVEQRVKTCRLEMARSRLAEADALIREGDAPGAGECLEDALAICDAPEIAEQVTERKQRYEAEEARRLVGEIEEMTEDELLAVIAGTWSEAQADEYAQLPDAFREALLAGHDQDHERAVELIEAVIDAPDLSLRPRYAHAELGRQLSAAGRHEQALEAFDRFIGAVEGDDEARDVVVGVLTAQGRILLVLERPDDAEEQLLEATRVAPDSHAALLNLGMFLRTRGEYERSLAALRTAAELMGQMHPDFRVIREMGFTYLAMGRKREAEETLSAVIEHHASRGTHDQFDPAAATVLAKLFEDKGDFKGASDIFRHLAAGYDSANHFSYNLQAARLLGLGGADAELVERYLTRAAELAETDAELALLDQRRSAKTS
jgi:tetratricopeptide (TPR) repeat protein